MNPPTPTGPRNSTPDVSQQQMPMNANIQLAALQLATQLLGQTNAMTQAAPLMVPQTMPLQQTMQTAQALLPLLGLQVNSPANFGGSASASPVGQGTTYQNDDDVVINALRDAEGKGKSYKQALEELHGVNGRPAHQWKDYYLEHARRINSMLPAERPHGWTKKPSLDRIIKPTSHSSQHERRVSFTQAGNSKAESPASGRNGTSSKHRLDDDESDYEHANNTKRSRKSSFPSKDKGKHRSPFIPSREPTPPKPVSAHPTRERYYRYTDEDREYLVKYANFRLSEDPSLKKTDISFELASKAPHHSASSWQSHWSSRREELDRQIIYFRDEVEDGPDGGNGHDSDGDSSDDYESGSSDGESDAEEDIRNMSGAGQTINDADKRVIARYIASVGSEWDSLSSREKWQPVEQLYPQRNYKAWGQLYSNHAKKIDPIVRRYRKQARAGVQSQKAIPAWARKKSES